MTWIKVLCLMYEYQYSVFQIFSEVGHKQKPYLKHVANGQISGLKFCPFEDILGVGTSKGFDSVIVPGTFRKQLLLINQEFSSSIYFKTCNLIII